jgi:hypothetical protein
MVSSVHILIIMIIFFSSMLYSQDSQFRISDDTMELRLDKKAHLWVSFGMYYFFFTSLNSFDSISTYTQLDAMLLSVVVGLGYEVYQGSSLSNADGFSKEDFYYNLIGIGFARFTHEIILYFRDLI